MINANYWEVPKPPKGRRGVDAISALSLSDGTQAARYEALALTLMVLSVCQQYSLHLNPRH